MPLFATQGAGAFNDHFFKAYVVLLFAFKASPNANGEQGLLVLAGAVFMAPFALFSLLGGRLADRFSKTHLIAHLKIAELGIMTLGGLFLLADHRWGLFVTLFLMGTQSALFGPAKYAVLPELVPRGELMRSNAAVEAGTFLAILVGTIAAGVAHQMGELRHAAFVVCAVAVFGALSSRQLPRTFAPPGSARAPASASGAPVSVWRLLLADRSLVRAVLGLSWFWMLGALLVSVLPVYVRSNWAAEASVATLLFAIVCVGIAMGAWICGRLSRGHLEVGFVPAGAILVSVFLIDLWWSSPTAALASATSTAETLGWVAFLNDAQGVRVTLDLLAVATGAGLFSVPLNTWLQIRSPESRRAHFVAANNVVNAIFIVVGSVVLAAFMFLGIELNVVFLALALGNALVALFAYKATCLWTLRFLARTLAHTVYSLRFVGQERLPQKGAALLVCNHVSFIDFLIIAAACPRPVQFVMYHAYYKRLVGVRHLLKDAGVIPIAPAHEDRNALKSAFDQIDQALGRGRLVCIFPEGKITRDGALNPFRTGVERIIQRRRVPVFPMALHGLNRSLFSRQIAKKWAPRNWLKWPRTRVRLTVGSAVPPHEVTAQRLAGAVAHLADLPVPAEAQKLGALR